MKVFITGGTGYIGQATITALRAHGHDVVALARSHRAAQRLELLGAETVAGDLTDTDTLRNTAEHADAAIHLAQDYTTSAATADLGAATAIQHGLGSRPYVHTGGPGCTATPPGSSTKQRHSLRRRSRPGGPTTKSVCLPARPMAATRSWSCPAPSTATAAD